MNIRTAILKAADSIEMNPGLFNFMATDIPDGGCGTPGCALGWIGHHLNATGDEDFMDVAVSIGCPIESPDGFSPIGAEFGFYRQMEDLSGSVTEWRGNATNCAKALRQYADKYHPLNRYTDALTACDTYFNWRSPLDVTV